MQSTLYEIRNSDHETIINEVGSDLIIFQSVSAVHSRSNFVLNVRI